MSPSEESVGDGLAGHLDDETVRRFRGRTLGPEELIAAGRHLAACPQCRSRMESTWASSSKVRSLRRQLSHEEGGGPHLDFESTLMPYVEGALPQGEREMADRHLDDCAACRRELDDLAAFRNAYDANPASAPVVAARPRRSASPQWRMTRWLPAAPARPPRIPPPPS